MEEGGRKRKMISFIGVPFEILSDLLRAVLSDQDFRTLL